MFELSQPLERETIRINSVNRSVEILDQRALPHCVAVLSLQNEEQACEAIRSMAVRGAPLIGITGAAAMALACSKDSSNKALNEAAERVKSARPTAVNLAWAVDKVLQALLSLPASQREAAAWDSAESILEQERRMSLKIGKYALGIIEALYRKLGRPVRLLTHCNAGALATVGPGTATAGFYAAHQKGIPIEVYADETRPRLQGAMTAWELCSCGVPVSLIADNAGGHLMREGLIDAVFVGADRIAANGDTANKIGTYLKALSAADNNIPFYVAAPVSTFDASLKDGSGIPIEERSGDEIRRVYGADENGLPASVFITSRSQKVMNPGFDVTPSRLITAFVTDQGVFAANELEEIWKDGKDAEQ
ncbi:S-methyl-5-thioribose-1-phosphate isomerase [Parasutterella muris]|uniref:Methylthioribose-1-phosphate isomerase n=1 Tax=Parasutterella muris TaxID=2565572 RepID=A0A6L6YKW5_9BURK|nr:S-methyl-5-thioribose-1-phosphate isomerase [Parasutterella muris]MVX55721.1 S-methyl-5-thioribose-1-phosphate isomerase [Parasutterella muris]